MAFQMYTFGGKFAWEDVFFYQGFRIQRHYKYKDYRLLDQFDILRAEGTYKECHAYFIELAKAYEMSRQKSHVVVMLHGLNENNKYFQNMWQAMKDENYITASINYPSTRKNIESHAKQLNILLENLSDAKEVSFIAKGVGGIVLRELLSKKSDWQKNIKVNKIIQIAPPNRGSRFFSMLNKLSIFRFLLGPIITELDPLRVDKLPNFPKKTNLGIITCDYPLKRYTSLLPKKVRDNMPSQLENAINNEYESLYVQNTNFNVLNNKKIIQACISFIKNGYFK